jgi:formylglycine-generating enzyme required for sulfatase activity
MQRRVVGAIAGGVLLLVLALIGFRFWAFFTAPNLPDLNENDRGAVLDVGLRRTGVAALGEGGEMAVLRAGQVAHTAGSRCNPRQVCTESKGNGPRTTCHRIDDELDCFYEVVTSAGSAAAIHLRVRENPAYSPRQATESEDPLRHAPVLAAAPELEASRVQLCQYGYCRPGAMDGWKRDASTGPAGKATVPVAATGDGCKGVRTLVVGRGPVCLDPTVEAVREFRDCRDEVCGPVMVALSPGRYLRGTAAADAEALAREHVTAAGALANERPQHEVSIDYHLAIGKFEVTFEDWDSCVSARGCWQSRAPGDEGWGRGRRPVMSVSWRDIEHEYLPWLNNKLGLRGAAAYRLPSDAEWEYAARAGTTSRTAFGNTIAPTQARFAAADKPAGRTAEAGSHRANAFGLHDMHGNVAEWVEDCVDDVSDHTGAPADGSARSRRVCGLRGVRGGSWSSPAVAIRSASRASADPESRSTSIGFRVARTLPAAR